MRSDGPARRDFLRASGRAVLLLLFAPADVLADRSATPLAHPDPRPDVDGSRVLPADRVAPHVAQLFDRIREIPHVVDGLACRCGCGAVEGMRSLLSCYEGMGMAQYCQICEGDGRLAARMTEEGHTLDEIRAAFDGLPGRSAGPAPATDKPWRRWRIDS